MDEIKNLQMDIESQGLYISELVKKNQSLESKNMRLELDKLNFKKRLEKKDTLIKAKEAALLRYKQVFRWHMKRIFRGMK